MIPTTTVEMAREIAAHLTHPRNVIGNALRSLTDQVEALTKERDECRRQSDLQMNSAIKFCQERNAARIERDALAAAAKLAAAALEKVHYEAINSGVNNYSRLLGDIAKAHDALKAGVQ